MLLTPTIRKDSPRKRVYSKGNPPEVIDLDAVIDVDAGDDQAADDGENGFEGFGEDEDAYDETFFFHETKKRRVEEPAPSAAEEVALERVALMPPPEHSSSTATKALQRELLRMVKTAETTPVEERGWSFEVSELRNMYQWVVRLVEFDPKLPLAQDLARYGLTRQGITIEVRFSPEFPLAPPYIRVVKPRMMQHMHGGGGHVTAGGSICMDLLTSSGWLPSYTVESALLQVRMALTSTDPYPARLDPHRWQQSYTPQEAIFAFERVAQAHNWTVPQNWNKYFGNDGASVPT